MLLSDVRQATEKSATIFQEIGQNVQDVQIKELLDARAFISRKTLDMLDQCFKLIGEQPVKLTGRLQETFIDDFRKEIGEIQGPVAKQIFVLAKLNHLTHLRIGEYVALTAASDMSGNYAVGVLLETCLADKIAFVERTRRLLRHIVETKVDERKLEQAA